MQEERIEVVNRTNIPVHLVAVKVAGRVELSDEWFDPPKTFNNIIQRAIEVEHPGVKRGNISFIIEPAGIKVYRGIDSD